MPGDERTAEKPLLAALAGRASARIPFWFMRQAGRYLPEYRAVRQQAGGFLDLCFTPELAAEVTLQPVRRFGMDAAILFSDILVIPHALGQRVSFQEGVGPVLPPLRRPADLSSLSGDGLHASLAPVYDTVRRVRAALPEGVTLIGFAGAPWTVATYMVEGGGSRDHAATKRWAYGDPASFGELMQRLTDSTVAYLVAQIDAGAEAIQLFDSWAGALSESGVRCWSLQPMAEIVRRIGELRPGVPVIAFPRGVGAAYVMFAAEPSFSALSLDTGVPLQWAAENLQACRAVQGNLDPQLVVVGGTAMRDEALRILDVFGDGPFVFNLGHGFVPDTPPEHVAELSDLIREWRR